MVYFETRQVLFLVFCIVWKFIRLDRVGYRKNPAKYNHETMICALDGTIISLVLRTTKLRQTTKNNIKGLDYIYARVSLYHAQHGPKQKQNQML